MNSTINKELDIPSGFVEEEMENQLYQEDLSEDDELWLVRMPPDIELSLLDRKKIFLSNNIGHSSIQNVKTKNGMLLECLSESCEIPKLNVVLPRKADKKLCTVNKKFKGMILISEGFMPKDDVDIKLERDNGVTEIKSENDLPENTSILTEEKKSRKKKRRLEHSESSDINYNTDHAENVSSKKKKHSRKNLDMLKTKSLGVEIKNEPFSMDLDSFPVCISQK